LFRTFCNKVNGIEVHNSILENVTAFANKILTGIRFYNASYTKK